MTVPVNSQPEATANQIAAPVSGKERIDFVDILRGFAVLGILLVNMLSFAGLPSALVPGISPLDRWAVLLLEFLVRAKFYSLFSFLFGWGMAIQMLRAEARGVRFVGVYSRRLLILLAIGVIHGALIWSGDILTLYALLGFLLLLLRKRSPRFLLLASAAFLLFAIFMNMPGAAADYVRNTYTAATASLRWSIHPDSAYANGTWLGIQGRRFQDYVTANSWALFFVGNVFAMFLLGLYVGKRRIFEDIDAHLTLVKRVLVIGLVIGVILNGVFIGTAIWNFSGWPAGINPAYYRLIRVGTRTLGAPALTLFYVSALILLSRSPRWRPRLAPLAPVGRMALSNYLTHSVIGTLIFYNYGLGLYGRIGVTASIAISILIFVGQIRFSAWWFDRYQFGPVEWIWRALTYGHRPPLRRGEAAAYAPTWLRRLRRVNQTRALVVAWLLLLLWGIALGLWYDRLGIGQVESLPALVTTDDEALQSLLDSLNTNGIGATTAVEKPYVAPDLLPASYDPTPLVAGGDMWALAGVFDVELALAEIETLSSAPFAGRAAGTPGGWAAGDYIAAQFADLGLQPAGDNGEYFQRFPLDNETFAGAPRLAITSPDGVVRDDYQAHGDFSAVANTFMGGGSAAGPVVWVNDCDRSDFDDMDVSDSVVFCRGTTGRVTYTQAARNALEHGAAGLLLLVDIGLRPLDFGETYFQAWVPEPLPTARVGPEVAADLLAGSGRALADLSYNFTSFPLETEVSLTVTTAGPAGCAADPCQGRNVLGVLPGRDPQYAGDVIIIGGHYDHLGAAPDGPVWAGANDNASGVAVMLAIAHSWQMNGYVPRRTVLFAAWDGEEMGLLGSTHYVENPRFLLADTIASLQLDMVGAGPDQLFVDGDGPLAPTLELAAAQVGITTTVTSVGRSDHVPFIEAGVPASLISWFDGGPDLAHYHRPDDTMAIIEPARVETAGRIAALTILGLAEGEPQINELFAERAAAVLAADANAFLATSLPELRRDDAAWLAAAQAMAPTDFAIQVDALHAAGRSATVDLTYILTQGSGDDQISTVLELTGRLQQVDGAWAWAGVELAPAAGPGTFAIRAPAGSVDTLGDFNERLTAQHLAWSELLGLDPKPEPRLSLYPNGRSLRADTDFALPADTVAWVGPGHIKLVYSSEVTGTERVDRALAQLILADAGVTEAAAPWLWHGLPPALAALADREAVHETLLPDLGPALADGEAGIAADWAAVTYLQRELGWDGLGAFIADLGAACKRGQCSDEGALTAALTRSLAVDAAGFDTAWRNAWQADIDAAQTALDALLDERTAAALSGDEGAWLATVDGTVPGLAADERGWLADFTSLAPAAVTFTGRPTTLYDDGSFQARVTTHITGADGDARAQTSLVIMSRLASNLRWAGAPGRSLTVDGVTILYPAGAAELAAELLPTAQILITDIGAILNRPPLTDLVIRLYPSGAALRATATPLLANSDWVDGWTAPAGSVQLAIDLDMDGAQPAPELAKTYQTRLAELIARRYLYDQGVTDDWLLLGLPLYAAETAGVRGVVTPYVARLPGVVSGIEHDRLTSLGDLSAPWTLPRVEADVVIAQAWDSLRFLADTAGIDALLDLAAAQAAGGDRSAAAATVLNGTLADFSATWFDSLARGHAQPDWFALIDSFDVSRALAHVAALTDPALNGRRAGSAGAWSAADYIAAEFEAIGLLPVGDAGPGAAPFIGGTDYFQPFALEYAELTAMPVLNLSPAGAETPTQFIYRQDFLLLLAETGGYGTASGQLIWVNDGAYTGIDLDGAIVIREAENDYLTEMQRALEHGAGGLILVERSLNTDDELLAKPAMPVVFADTPVIPVVALAKEGTERFFEATGTTSVTFDRAGAALPLNVTVDLSVPLTAPVPGTSANVLGLLPGADPALRDEVIIVGAHYDFVGDDANQIVCDGVFVTAEPANASVCERVAGFAYPGANDDASGVAAMLELARLWSSGAYRPARSILFIAWGAQEAGEVGSRYYIEHPVFPLADTVGIVQFDGVGGGEGFRVLAEGWRDTAGAFLFGMEAATTYFLDRLQTTVPDTRSDHMPFLDAGVPAILVSWVGARDLNLPDFEADPILPERLELTAQLAGIAVMVVAR